MSHQPIQTDWRLILLGFLVAGSLIYLLSGRCSGQTISQPVPQLSSKPLQLQQPQVYAVPARGPLPWIRWQVFGRPSYDLYIGVGQPWSATVQPVVPYGRAW